MLASVPAQTVAKATYHSATHPSLPKDTFLRLDVRISADVDQLFAEILPDVVVHAASIGSVDYAEKNPQETHAVNVQGTRNIIEACQRYNAKPVFVSSNAVFDGENPPYEEQSATNSLNYYGKLKIEGEQIVLQSGLPYLILRPILMYGWPNPSRRDNPVTWWLKNLRQRKPLSIVNDVYSKPLLANDCADACWAAIKQMRTGVFHIAGRDRVTLYDFALEVARVFELDENLITPVPSSFFPNIASRPKDTSFVTHKMESVLGVAPIGITQGLQWMKANQPTT